MRGFSIQRLACTFAILYLVFEPKINVIGADEKELEKSLPSDYGQVFQIGSTILPNVWESNSIRFSRSSDNVVTIIYSGPYKEGWMGIGWSKTGRMIGSSAMVGWTGDGGKNMIKQYSLEGYSASKVVPDKGELQLTKVAPVSIVIKGTLYLAFQLKFPNNVMKHKLIFTSSPDTPIRDVLTIHTDTNMKEIDFNAGHIDDSAMKIKTAHGWVAFLTWDVVIQIGIAFPAVMKHLDPQWFYIHMSVQIVGYMMAVITVLLGLKVQAGFHKLWTFHKFIGLTALFLATLQVLAIVGRPAKDAPSRKMWSMYHRTVGYIAMFLGLLNVIMGVRHGHASLGLQIVFIIWFIVSILTYVVLEKRAAERKLRETQELPPPVFSPAAP